MKPYFQDENFTLYNADYIVAMEHIYKENGLRPLVDLVVTSPPYNVGIEYDRWNDKMSFDDYFSFVERFFEDVQRLMYKDSRIAINIPFEVNMGEHAGRVNISGQYMKIMSERFYPFGIVRLQEPSQHRRKNTAWGSFASPSCPCIYNPDECVLLYHNGTKVKHDKNNTKTKIPAEIFKKLVKGIWDYKPETHGLTEANFSKDIPVNAIMMLTYKGDVVLDPFIGSGTTAIACLETDRKCIGVEISEEYCDIAVERYCSVAYNTKLF